MFFQSGGLPTLCEGPATSTHWKSESVSNLPTGVGARDAYASKKKTVMQRRAAAPRRGGRARADLGLILFAAKLQRSPVNHGWK